MSRVLLVYGTTDGHTQKVADVMAQTLRADGLDVDVIQAKESRTENSLAFYDGVIVAASVHRGHYQRPVKKWVTLHVQQLNQKPNAFISVCLAVLEEDPKSKQELQTIMKKFFSATSWEPKMVKLVAGAIPYTRYGFFKKWIMKRIAGKSGSTQDTDTSRDYEYTNWGDLKSFLRDYKRRIPGYPVSRMNENLQHL